MNIGKAFIAGLAGGAVMTLAMLLARETGLTTMDIEKKLGSMITGDLSRSAWQIGLAIHFVVSGLLALIYAFAFERLTHKAGWVFGAAFGLVHAIISGFVMGALGEIHPLMRDGLLRAPGLFASNFGSATVALFVVGHVVYGAVVGLLYKALAPHKTRIPSPA
jgi:hypothetical protein